MTEKESKEKTVVNKRSGQDRREVETGPPTSYERRRTIEQRQPEVVELELSEEALKALGFTPHRRP